MLYSHQAWSSPVPGPKSEGSRATLVNTYPKGPLSSIQMQRQSALSLKVPAQALIARRVLGAPVNTHIHVVPGARGINWEGLSISRVIFGHRVTTASVEPPLAGPRSTLLLAPSWPAEGSSCQGTAPGLPSPCAGVFHGDVPPDI